MNTKDEDDDKEILRLCFIKRLYKSKKDEEVFRFYFTTNIEDCVGENWDVIADGMVEPPYNDYIDETYIFKSKKINLELLEDSNEFTYNDGADTIIALGWEEIEDVSPFKRLVFQFSETLQEVEEKMFSRELVLTMES